MNPHITSLAAVTLGDVSELVALPTKIRLSLTGGAVIPLIPSGVDLVIVEGSMKFGAHKITSVRVADVIE